MSTNSSFCTLKINTLEQTWA